MEKIKIKNIIILILLLILNEKMVYAKPSEMTEKEEDGER